MLVKALRQSRWLSRLMGAVLLFFAAADAPSTTARAGAPDPSVVGQWSSYVLWPSQATHALMLPTGNLLFWRTPTSYIWNPATEVITTTPDVGYDHFCAGHSFLANGRVLVTGGAVRGAGQSGKGVRQTTSYDPFNNSWTSVPMMKTGRWYPTNTTLSNGDVLVTSGTTGTGSYNDLPQVWQVASGTWRNLTTARQVVPWYPWMSVAPNGKVFMAGPSQSTQYLDVAGTGSWSIVGSSNYGPRYYGSSVVYDEGKILIAGGEVTLKAVTTPTNTVEVIDLQAGATWRYVAPMGEPRAQGNTTLLPDGKVLATGGHKGIGLNDPTAPVYLAEMWDPQTETWSTMATPAIFRGNHSTATLLPDARVVVAGGDLANPSGANREIYSPPYLFKGPRPTITGAPGAVGYGQTFFVATPDAANITSVNWLALGATTHAFNQGQRINRLTFTQAQGGLDVTAPPNAILCPPGYYMLFILTSDGVPSVARIIKIRT